MEFSSPIFFHKIIRLKYFACIDSNQIIRPYHLITAFCYISVYFYVLTQLNKAKSSFSSLNATFELGYVIYGS